MWLHDLQKCIPEHTMLCHHQIILPSPGSNALSSSFDFSLPQLPPEPPSQRLPPAPFCFSLSFLQLTQRAAHLPPPWLGPQEGGSACTKAWP